MQRRKFIRVAAAAAALPLLLSGKPGSAIAEGVGDVGEKVDLVAGRLQPLRQKVGQFFAVLDNQYSHGCDGPFAPPVTAAYGRGTDLLIPASRGPGCKLYVS